MRKFKTVIVMAICFIALSLVTVPEKAFSQTTRTCKAYYEVKVVSVNDMKADFDGKKLGDFLGKGRCRNRFYGNDCRRAARNNAHRCMKTHWSDANSNRIPDACTEFPDHTGIFNYNIRNLRKTVEAAACSSLSSPHYRNKKAKVTYSLYGVTSGDDGCGPNTKNSLRELIVQTSCECSKP